MRRSLLIAAIVCVAPASRAFAGGCGHTQHLYGVSLNGETVSDGTVFLVDNGTYLVPDADLKRWRLTLPQDPPYVCDGIPYHSLASLRVVSPSVDAEKQVLVLKAPPDAFSTTVISHLQEPSMPPRADLGLYLNYDATYLHMYGNDVYGGLFNGVAFNSFGVVSTGFLVEHNDDTRVIRLESAWQYDDPSRMWRFRGGDSMTRSGMLGGWSRFAGLQLGTNFSLNPRFIHYPRPSLIEGMAEAPTVLDIYVNNVTALKERVPEGPFQINDIPVVSGLGTVSVVTRDLLGREVVTTQQYYLEPQLLRKGLSEFSVEAGYARLGYGTDSNEYGNFLASATHRYGITDLVTVEAHAEKKGGAATVATGVTFVPASIGTVSVAVAGSRREGEKGGRVFASYNLIGRRASVGLSGTFSSRSYCDAVSDYSPFGARRTITSFVGVNLNSLGNVAASFTDRTSYRTDGNMRIFTANYNIRAAGGIFSLSYLQSINHEIVRQGTLQYTVSIDSRTLAMPRVSLTDEGPQGGFSVERALPSTGQGYSGRVSGDFAGDFQHVEVDALRRGSATDVSAQYAFVDDHHSFRGGVSGAILLMDGGFHTARRIDRSFALVKIPGVAGAPVSANNQEVGITDSNGYAVATNINPYQENTISVETENLPLTVSLDSYREKIVPYENSGGIVEFGVHRGRNVTLTLTDGEGTPLPVGSTVTDGSGVEYPVGKDGMVFIPEVKGSQLVLRAATGSGTCTALVGLPDKGEEIRIRQPVVCR